LCASLPTRLQNIPRKSTNAQWDCAATATAEDTLLFESHVDDTTTRKEHDGGGIDDFIRDLGFFLEASVKAGGS